MKKFLILLLFISCSPENQEAEVTDQVEIPSTNVLSEEDFSEMGYQFITAEEYNFGQTIPVSGYIDVPPEGRASVSAFYGGFVKSINLIPGEEVKRGQVLILLENPEFLEMQRDYLQVKESLAYLKDDYERQKTLLAENISSKKSFLKAETEYKQAQARHTALSSQLSLLNISVAKVEKGEFTSQVQLTSPISGFITKVHVVQGEYLPPAQKAVEIINTGHMHLEIKVFENDLARLRKGQSVRMHFPGNPENVFNAKIYLIGQEISGEDRTAMVHAHIDERHESMLRPGMYLDSEIILDDKLAPALAESAFQNGNLRVTRSKDWPIQIETIEIETGQTMNGHVELRSAPADNLRIIGKMK